MDKRVKNWKIGADIEFFLKDKQTGEIVSAEGFVQGTKHNPFNFDKSNKFFATSLDNVLAEGCIPPIEAGPTGNEKFKLYIQKLIAYFNHSIPSHLVVASVPSAILDPKWLQTENSKTFGCDPDLCVWTKSVNEKPTGVNENLRSAGGHIHIGHDDPDNMETNEAIIKAMDLFVGIPSVLQEPENERKSLYGKAGCFRFKNYGVEYRTISNYYAGDDRLSDWVYNATSKAIEAVNEGMDFDQYKERILDAINGNNKVIAGNLVRELDLELA
jgi:hypothetical protein